MLFETCLGRAGVVRDDAAIDLFELWAGPYSACNGILHLLWEKQHWWRIAHHLFDNLGYIEMYVVDEVLAKDMTKVTRGLIDHFFKTREDDKLYPQLWTQRTENLQAAHDKLKTAGVQRTSAEILANPTIFWTHDYDSLRARVLTRQDTVMEVIQSRIDVAYKFFWDWQAVLANRDHNRVEATGSQKIEDDIHAWLIDAKRVQIYQFFNEELRDFLPDEDFSFRDKASRAEQTHIELARQAAEFHKQFRHLKQDSWRPYRKNNPSPNVRAFKNAIFLAGRVEVDDAIELFRLWKDGHGAENHFMRLLKDRKFILVEGFLQRLTRDIEIHVLDDYVAQRMLDVVYRIMCYDRKDGEHFRIMHKRIMAAAAGCV